MYDMIPPPIIYLGKNLMYLYYVLRPIRWLGWFPVCAGRDLQHMCTTAPTNPGLFHFPSRKASWKDDGIQTVTSPSIDEAGHTLIRLS